MRLWQVRDELHLRQRLLVSDHQALLDALPPEGQWQRQLQGTKCKCAGGEPEERYQPLAAEREIHALVGQRPGVD